MNSKSYPIHLDLEGRSVLVIGGGKVAARKLKSLLSTGANINLVSPEINKELENLIKTKDIVYFKRKFSPEDIDNKFLIIAATGDKEINKKISHLALAEDKLLNVVDNPQVSNFNMPATVRRKNLLISIGTEGTAPALSREIRIKLEKEFGPQFSNFLDIMEKLRPQIKQKVDDINLRKKTFNALADLELVQLLKTNPEIAFRKMKKIIRKNLDYELFVKDEENMLE